MILSDLQDLSMKAGTFVGNYIIARGPTTCIECGKSEQYTSFTVYEQYGDIMMQSHTTVSIWFVAQDLEGMLCCERCRDLASTFPII